MRVLWEFAVSAPGECGDSRVVFQLVEDGGRFIWRDNCDWLERGGRFDEEPFALTPQPSWPVREMTDRLGALLLAQTGERADAQPA